MANMIIASSKTQIPSTSSSSFVPKTPKFQLPQLPQIPILKTEIKNNTLSLKSTVSIATAAATLIATTPLPSLAAEIEKAALFDFNLTLPIIMGEFLFLMFALDKIYYSPLGNFMDARDAEIKEKLNSVKDTSTEVKQLEDEATAIMKAARAEISAALNQMKKETTVEVEAKLAEGRVKVEAELAEALAKLEEQKVETIKPLY
ncbi:hypothetical protein AQUCO_06700047v1 [Aquilegia coerulea]|uniref:ATP synthase subunit b', chloroplastic n=1 Tax=Aquilegia coerulea TaxID=218851 RepID=A0A2G5CBW7_AQUCA|nr:hypothetical protein AQUCO_06700047v1 [Aquilegia coerulea]